MMTEQKLKFILIQTKSKKQAIKNHNEWFGAGAIKNSSLCDPHYYWYVLYEKETMIIMKWNSKYLISKY